MPATHSVAQYGSPLNKASYSGVRGGTADIAIVEFRHRDEIFESAYLVSQLLALANHLVGRPHVVDLVPLFFFGFDQAVDAVQRNAAVIADNPAPTISIGQAGDDAGLPASHDFRRVGVEDAVVMRLAIFSESLVNRWVSFKTSGLEPRFDHAQAAKRKYCPFERLVGLQSNNHFVGFVDIAGFVRQHR